MTADIRTAVNGLEAHVYVIGFTSGLVKVGYSAKPDRRMKQHEDSGRSYGNAVTGRWVSGPHVGAAQNEEALIGYCRRNGRRAQGNEWFTGVEFSAVRDFAQGLRFRRATKDQIAQYELKVAERAEALKAAWGLNRAPARLLRLPDRIDADHLARLPMGGLESEMEATLARLLKLEPREVAELSENDHHLIREHLAEFWNLTADRDVLQAQVEEAERLLERHATDTLGELRKYLRLRLDTENNHFEAEFAAITSDPKGQ